MNRLTRILALLFAMALVASACGSDSDDTATEEEGAEELQGGGVDDSAAEEALSGADDEEGEGEGEGEGEEAGPSLADATSIEELDAVWAEERAAIVEMIKAEGYGVDENNVLNGPAGFTVDLNECPADWSNTEGLEDGKIKIGHTTAQSGNLAAYGDVAVGMDVYYDYINENGGINGSLIELETKDDGYESTRTIELVDELLQSTKPFYIETLGSPNTLATYDKLNEVCVPQPFVMTGHPAWGDPVEHPWTTGIQMSYSTEAVFWGQYIKQTLADDLPVKVAALVNDNDFGKAYGIGFERWAEANPDVVSEFVQVGHDPAAATVTNEMTTLAAEDPDVFISMTAGNTCLLAITEAGNNGLRDSAKLLFTPSVCKGANAFMIPAGELADGWLIVGGGLKTTTDPQYTDEPFISFLNEQLEGAGLDSTVDLYGTGFGLYAWPQIQALLIASELDGGLTRTNLMLAVRSMEMTNPITLDGITFAMNGNDDAYFIEGSDFAVYDAENESWLQEGDVVDLNQQSGLCSWTDDGCA